MMHTQKVPVARGVLRKDGRKSCVVHFPPDMFDQMRARAIAGNTSFGEQVRTFCQWGLDAVEKEQELG